MKLTILHLADLHCSKLDELYLKTIADGLREDLLKQSELGLRPDMICITGDIINKGELSSEEFDLAESVFLKPLQDSLGIPRDSFFFVPGNHEVDRTQISQAFELGLTQSITSPQTFRQFCQQIQKGNPDAILLKQKLKAYSEFLNKQGAKHRKYSSFFFEAFEFKIGEIKVGIITLNSSWRCSQYGSDDRRLVIGDHVIIEAASKISDCDIKLCLCHHPIEMLAEWDTKPVRQALAKHFNVLLNGHVHDSDAIATKQILGNLFVSTAGCLKPTDQFTSYSIIEVDLTNDVIRCFFRKWYKERQEFDQDTSKASNGKIEYSGIKVGSPAMAAALPFIKDTYNADMKKDLKLRHVQK